jgi:hypothetical protein
MGSLLVPSALVEREDYAGLSAHVASILAAL